MVTANALGLQRRPWPPKASGPRPQSPKPAAGRLAPSHRQSGRAASQMACIASERPRISRACRSALARPRVGCCHLPAPCQALPLLKTKSQARSWPKISRELRHQQGRPPSPLPGLLILRRAALRSNLGGIAAQAPWTASRARCSSRSCLMRLAANENLAATRTAAPASTRKQASHAAGHCSGHSWATSRAGWLRRWAGAPT